MLISTIQSKIATYKIANIYNKVVDLTIAHTLYILNMLTVYFQQV